MSSTHGPLVDKASQELQSLIRNASAACGTTPPASEAGKMGRATQALLTYVTSALQKPQDFRAMNRSTLEKHVAYCHMIWQAAMLLRDAGIPDDRLVRGAKRQLDDVQRTIRELDQHHHATSSRMPHGASAHAQLHARSAVGAAASERSRRAEASVQITEQLKSRVGHSDAAIQTATLINLAQRCKTEDPARYDQHFHAPMTLIGEVYSCVAESPAGADAICQHLDVLAGLRTQCEEQITRLQAVQGTARSPLMTSLRQELVGHLEKLNGMIDARTAYLNAQAKEDPLLAQSVYAQKAIWTRGAVTFLQAEVARLTAEGKPDAAAAIQKTMDTLQLRCDALANAAARDALRVVDAKDVLGRKPVRGIKALIHPVRYLTSYFARKAIAKAIHDPSAPMALGNKHLREQDIVEEAIVSTYRSAGLPVPKGLRKTLEHQWVATLNQQPWVTVHQTMQFMHGGDRLQMGATQTPAAQLPHGFTEHYGYTDGGGVCSSTTAESTHAVNLWSDSMLDPSGKECFQGMRHGVISAFGMTGEYVQKLPDQALMDALSGMAPRKSEQENRGIVVRIRSDVEFAKEVATQMRAFANVNRATEIVAGALVTDADVMKYLKEHPHATEVPMQMCSVSLLTPDDVREMLSGAEPSSDNEKLMLREQTAAWQHLQNDPPVVKVTVNGVVREIKVKVAVDVFNFGVNKGPLVGYGPISPESNLVSGWDTVRDANRRALTSLLGDPDAVSGAPGGRVGQFLNNFTGDSVDRAVIVQLAQQIRQIWQDGSFMHEGHDPYKMVSRLALLSYLIGDRVCWNCKSGKDRTGELSVEAKMLLMQIRLAGGKVPPPDRALTPEEQQMFKEIALRSGNLEVQRANTGGAGFKLEGVSSITERLGGTAPKRQHRGLSKFTGS